MDFFFSFDPLASFYLFVGSTSVKWKGSCLAEPSNKLFYAVSSQLVSRSGGDKSKLEKSPIQAAVLLLFSSPALSHGSCSQLVLLILFLWRADL